MEAEFGSIQPVRFAQGRLMSSSGFEMRCKCGKSAGSAIMGKEAFIVYCQDCSPTLDYSAEFIYSPRHG